MAARPPAGIPKIAVALKGVPQGRPCGTPRPAAAGARAASVPPQRLG